MVVASLFHEGSPCWTLLRRSSCLQQRPPESDKRMANAYLSYWAVAERPRHLLATDFSCSSKQAAHKGCTKSCSKWMAQHRPKPTRLILHTLRRVRQSALHSSPSSAPCAQLARAILACAQITRGTVHQHVTALCQRLLARRPVRTPGPDDAPLLQNAAW